MHGVFKSYLSKYAMVQMQATVSALYEWIRTSSYLHTYYVWRDNLQTQKCNMHIKNFHFAVGTMAMIRDWLAI